MFTWHKDQWERVLGGGLERLPHALLLIGPAGLGKREFATELAAIVLCDAPSLSPTAPSACGSCPSCRWLAAESHPDLRLVSAEGENEEGEEGAAATSAKKKAARPVIKIEAVRALEDFVFVGSHRNARRVVLVPDADLMNTPAANALLKILEEPPAGVYFLLTSSRSQSLLATIRSRCRTLDFTAPERAVAEAWLSGNGADPRARLFLDWSGGAPLAVRRWEAQGLLPALEEVVRRLSNAHDPLQLAKEWDDLLKREEALKLEWVVEAVQRWLFDASLHGSGLPPRYHRAPLQAAPAANLERGVRGWRELLRFRRSARHPLNQLLFLEELAVFALHALQSPARTEAR
jgi:DNA polymerase-3 subunit delta'